MDAGAPSFQTGELGEGLRLVERPDADMLERVFRLRVVAWRARSPSFPEIVRWSDPVDDSARHWVVVTQEGEPIAAARLSVHSSLAEVPDAAIYRCVEDRAAGPVASFNRLVVHPSWRGRGLVAVLDRVRLRAALQTGARSVVFSTQSGERRIESAAALGFVVMGQAGRYSEGPLSIANGTEVVLLFRLQQGTRP